MKEYLNINKKIEIINLYESKVFRQKQLTKEYEVSASCISKIIKKKLEIRKAFNAYENKNSSKSVATGKFPIIESTLLRFIRVMRENKMVVNADILREKAMKIALELNISGFTASLGWFSRFKKDMR